MKTTKNELVFYPHFTKWRKVNEKYVTRLLNSIINLKTNLK